MIINNDSTIYRKNRRVMFIEPPFYRLYHDQYCLVKYPLALGYLSGSVIKNTNWTVQTYNADFNQRKKIFVPENDYISNKGFERYLSSIKDFSLPIWEEVRKSIELPHLRPRTIKTLEENSFDLDFMKLSANYQNWFYMNGNIVDVVIENNKMKKFLLDNKVEFENLSSEFIKKIK